MRSISRMFIALFAVVVFAIPAISHAGAMIEIAGIKAYIADSESDKPTFKQQQEIKAAAVAYQTDGDVYRADVFKVVLLKKGTKIYAMIPYQSVFYTDKATILSAKDYRDANSKLQVKAKNGTFREGFAAYEVCADMWVAAGNCLKNTAYGKGGGAQFVVPNFIRQQAMYSDNRMLMQDWDALRQEAKAAEKSAA